MRRNPFENLEEMFDRFSRQVEEGMAEGTGFPVPGSISIDVADVGDEYVVTADLPGYDTDDIDLTLSNGTLRIDADREHEEREDTERYLRRERTRRSVDRRVQLPDPVDEDAVSASYSQGVLTVTLPKRDVTDDGQQIDIE